MSRIEGKTQAVKEWASTWPEIDGYIKLNAILGDRDEASMNTIHIRHGPSRVHVRPLDDDAMVGWLR